VEHRGFITAFRRTRHWYLILSQKNRVHVEDCLVGYDIVYSHSSTLNMAVGSSETLVTICHTTILGVTSQKTAIFCHLRENFRKPNDIFTHYFCDLDGVKVYEETRIKQVSYIYLVFQRLVCVIRRKHVYIVT
jgi:hypothetical protein